MDIVTVRRKRLRHLIDTCYGGLLVQFVQRTKISPSELSGLLRNKSFGEKKARLLEQRAGLPSMYFDCPDDSHLLVHRILEIVSQLSEEDQKAVLIICELFIAKKKNGTNTERVDKRQSNRRTKVVAIEPSENKRVKPDRRGAEDTALPIHT